MSQYNIGIIGIGILGNAILESLNFLNNENVQVPSNLEQMINMSGTLKDESPDDESDD